MAQPIRLKQKPWKTVWLALGSSWIFICTCTHWTQRFLFTIKVSLDSNWFHFNLADVNAGLCGRQLTGTVPDIMSLIILSGGRWIREDSTANNVMVNAFGRLFFSSCFLPRGYETVKIYDKSFFPTGRNNDIRYNIRGEKTANRTTCPDMARCPVGLKSRHTKKQIHKKMKAEDGQVQLIKLKTICFLAVKQQGRMTVLLICFWKKREAGKPPLTPWPVPTLALLTHEPPEAVKLSLYFWYLTQ